MRINTGWFADKARALFGSQGGDIVSEHDEHAGLVAVLDNDRPEWGFAAGEERRGYNNFQSAGGVGFGTYMGIRNPVDSGILVVTESLWLRPGAIPALSWIEIAWIDPAILAHSTFTALGANQRDGRSGIVPQNVGGPMMVFKKNAAIGAELNTITGFDPKTGPFTDPIIIPPGGLVVCLEFDPSNGNRQTNAALQACFNWRQRILQKSIKG